MDRVTPAAATRGGEPALPDWPRPYLFVIMILTFTAKITTIRGRSFPCFLMVFSL
jgi:hypothetical protein